MKLSFFYKCKNGKVIGKDAKYNEELEENLKNLQNLSELLEEKEIDDNDKNKLLNKDLEEIIKELRKNK
ncbi:hypothetical protein [Clostridium ganghwense]|uniref:Uncharacterized protein n=1 Tax=Clostridium ganghwense TaxID=312089 RepID=A0ABT4CUF5_9CLOT|nr:hypothetical protein [Clostridium ganghwense]MCY6372558.1 hypothetical protein [Clostridium ganghwense]